MLWLFATILAMQQEEVRVSSHAYTPTLRVATQEVEIAAVVRDGHGKVVSGLTKDDFRILDNGKVRVIDHFAIEKGHSESVREPGTVSAPETVKSGVAPIPADQKRFLALFIDDVNTHLGDLKRTQAAAEKFVKTSLKNDTRIGIFTTSGAVKLDFTTDESKVIEAIAAIKPHQRMPDDGLTGCPRITPYLAYEIAYNKDRSALGAVMYDAGTKDCPVTRAAIVTQAEETWRRAKEISTDTLDSLGRVVEHLGTMAGTRELLMASSGFLTVSMQQQKNAVIEQAIRAGVVISAMDSKGLFGELPAGFRPQDAVGYPAGNDRLRQAAQNWTMYETAETPIRVQTANEALANLAESTGGIFFHNNNDLNAGFRELGDPVEVIYRMTFHPETVASDDSYHKLKVIVKGSVVQTRPGYFAVKEAESLQGKIDREILANDTVADFPVVIAAEQAKMGLSVIFSVDISKLRFTKDGQRQVQRIAFTTALIDAQGKIAAAKESLMDLSLTEATYKRLVAKGLHAVVTLQVPPGTYKLRQVAEEAVDGKLACSSHLVKILSTP